MNHKHLVASNVMKMTPSFREFVHWSKFQYNLSAEFVVIKLMSFVLFNVFHLKYTNEEQYTL
jgi:hypothetical protein